jgi:hypothetical protein
MCVTFALHVPQIWLVEGEMGESKRRRAYGTFDGGPPSDTPTQINFYVVEPGDPALLAAALFDEEAARRLKLLFDLLKRFNRPPPMLCGACDHEFALPARPALLYWTEPAFPKADGFKSITGVLCAECALDVDSAQHRIARHLGVSVIGAGGVA